MKAFFLKVFSFFYFSTSVFATNIDLSVDMLHKTSRNAKVETYEAFVDESFGFHVTVSNSRSTPEDMSVPGLENFRVVCKSTSTSFELIGSRRSTSYMYHFELAPLKEGEFTLGPVTTVCEGEKQNSRAIKIKVQKTEQARQGKSTRTNQACFSEIDISNKTPFVWQSFLMTLRIYAQEGKVLDVQTDMPQISGFEVKKLNSYQKRMAIDRNPYAVIESLFLVTPTQAGTYDVGQFTVQYRACVDGHHSMRDDLFGGFFGRMMHSRDAVIRTQSAKVEVQAIPDASYPIDGVGTFSDFTIKTDKTEVSVGEPFKLTLTLEGNGNFPQIAPPKLSLSQGFKAYESKTDFNEMTSQESLQGGIKTFEYIVQATKPDQNIISPQKFAYFDVRTKKFKSLKTKPIPIKIEARDDEQPKQLAPSQNQTKHKTQENEPEVFELDGYSSSDIPSQGIPLWAFILLMFLPYLWWGTQKIQKWWKKRHSSSLLLISTMRKIDDCERQNDASQLYEIVTTFLTQHFEKDPSEAISEDWIFAQLELIGIPQGKIENFLEFLGTCAGQRFGSSSKHDDVPWLCQTVKQWLDDISKERS